MAEAWYAGTANQMGGGANVFAPVGVTGTPPPQALTVPGPRGAAGVAPLRGAGPLSAPPWMPPSNSPFVLPTPVMAPPPSPSIAAGVAIASVIAGMVVPQMVSPGATLNAGMMAPGPSGGGCLQGNCGACPPGGCATCPGKGSCASAAGVFPFAPMDGSRASPPPFPFNESVPEGYVGGASGPGEAGGVPRQMPFRIR